MNKKNRVRALSVKQPFAEAILRGRKIYEVRDGPVRIRGRIYIYASKGLPNEGQKQQAERYYDELDANPGDFQVGVLVGTVEIFHCDGGPKPIKYRWHLRAPERLPEPIQPQNRAQQVWFFPFRDK